MIFRLKKRNIKARYLFNGGPVTSFSFGGLADNTCWNALKKSGEKIYLITSSSIGEGKTTIAVNLALNIARRGRKVLLIDANLRNPTIGHIFGIQDLPGLTQFKGMSDIISEVQEHNIHVIPSGSIAHVPFEVLSSPMLGDLFNQVKNLYDHVIVDCTAVNLYTDPLLLCPLVDRVIFVVLADKTEKGEVLIARAKVLNVEGNILGVVLNRPVNLEDKIIYWKEHWKNMNTLSSD